MRWWDVLLIAACGANIGRFVDDPSWFSLTFAVAGGLVIITDAWRVHKQCRSAESGPRRLQYWDGLEDET